MIGFNFNLKLNFGQITDVQSNKITEILKNTQYENVVSTPVFKIFDDKNGSQIIINPEQFSFNVSRNYESSDLSTFVELCKQLMEALLENNKAEFASVRLVNVFGGECVDAKCALKTMSSFDFGKEPLNDISAIGYRFLMKNDNLYDEIKAEPLISDTNKLFVEGIFNKEKLSFENIDDFILYTYNKYNEKADYFRGLC